MLAALAAWDCELAADSTAGLFAERLRRAISSYLYNVASREILDVLLDANHTLWQRPVSLPATPIVARTRNQGLRAALANTRATVAALLPSVPFTQTTWGRAHTLIYLTPTNAPALNRIFPTIGVPGWEQSTFSSGTLGGETFQNILTITATIGVPGSTRAHHLCGQEPDPQYSTHWTDTCQIYVERNMFPIISDTASAALVAAGLHVVGNKFTDVAGGLLDAVSINASGANYGSGYDNTTADFLFGLNRLIGVSTPATANTVAAIVISGIADDPLCTSDPSACHVVVAGNSVLGGDYPVGLRFRDVAVFDTPAEIASACAGNPAVSGSVRDIVHGAPPGDGTVANPQCST
jgi:hypothetical protein